MIGRWLKSLTAPAAQASGAVCVEEGAIATAPLRDRMQELDRDPFLHVADWQFNLISVFDELRYDRSDGDYLSPAMRNHAVQKLQGLGFRQISGTVIENRAEDVRILIPKFHALGASPFDATRYTAKRPQDFYLLTPTQTACHFIDRFDTEEAVERIKMLIARQPINVLKIDDYLEDKPTHSAIKDAIGHLKYVQRMAVESEPLMGRRGLG